LHWFGLLQAEPFSCCTQTLPTQLNPVTQSVLVVQRVRQLVVPHT